jgi:hypothetical protein
MNPNPIPNQGDIDMRGAASSALPSTVLRSRGALSLAAGGLAVALALAAGCGAAADGAEGSEAPLATAPPPAGGLIESIESFGDGCPTSTTPAPVSPDGQAFTAIFSELQVNVGPGSQDNTARGCLLRVRVQVPSGHAFTLNGVHVRGFVSLEEGVSASRQSLYFLPGNRPETRAPGFEGPMQDDYFQGDVGPEAAVGWSPCGKGGKPAVADVWLASQIAVSSSAPEASGLLVVDTLDGELAWRACK